MSRLLSEAESAAVEIQREFGSREFGLTQSEQFMDRGDATSELHDAPLRDWSQILDALAYAESTERALTLQDDESGAHTLTLDEYRTAERNGNISHRLDVSPSPAPAGFSVMRRNDALSEFVGRRQLNMWRTSHRGTPCVAIGSVRIANVDGRAVAVCVKCAAVLAYAEPRPPWSVRHQMEDFVIRAIKHGTDHASKRHRPHRVTARRNYRPSEVESYITTLTHALFTDNWIIQNEDGAAYRPPLEWAHAAYSALLDEFESVSYPSGE